MAITSSVVTGKDAAEFATNLDAVVGTLADATLFKLVVISTSPMVAVVTQ